MLIDDIEELNRKAEALLSRKWTPLEAAREYVLLHLINQRRPCTREEAEDRVRVLHGEPTTTEFGNLFGMADLHARSLLIRAFGAGDLNTRGIEHLRDQQQASHEPMPSLWWRRLVDRDDNTSVGDEFPFHRLSWLDGVIRREKRGAPNEVPSAIVTNIEVDRLRLLDLVKPPDGVDQATAAVTATPKRGSGRPPDDERRAAVQQAAKVVVQKQFGTLTKFNDLVIAQHGDPNLNPKQIGRDMFGDK